MTGVGVCYDLPTHRPAQVLSPPPFRDTPQPLWPSSIYCKQTSKSNRGCAHSPHPIFPSATGKHEWMDSFTFKSKRLQSFTSPVYCQHAETWRSATMICPLKLNHMITESIWLQSCTRFILLFCFRWTQATFKLLIDLSQCWFRLCISIDTWAHLSPGDLLVIYVLLAYTEIYRFRKLEILI